MTSLEAPTIIKLTERVRNLKNGWLSYSRLCQGMVSLFENAAYLSFLETEDLLCIEQIKEKQSAIMDGENGWKNSEEKLKKMVWKKFEKDNGLL